MRCAPNMSRTIHALRGIRGQARREFHAETERTFSEFAAHDVALLESDDFLGGTFRRSDELPKVTDAELAQLDAMLERHGLARVLRSIRELCDGRGDVGLGSDSFEAEKGGDDWKGHADALESLLATLRGLS